MKRSEDKTARGSDKHWRPWAASVGRCLQDHCPSKPHKHGQSVTMAKNNQPWNNRNTTNTTRTAASTRADERRQSNQSTLDTRTHTSSDVSIPVWILALCELMGAGREFLLFHCVFFPSASSWGFPLSIIHLLTRSPLCAVSNNSANNDY